MHKCYDNSTVEIITHFEGLFFFSLSVNADFEDEFEFEASFLGAGEVWFLVLEKSGSILGDFTSSRFGLHLSLEDTTVSIIALMRESLITSGKFRNLHQRF